MLLVLAMLGPLLTGTIGPAAPVGPAVTEADSFARQWDYVAAKTRFNAVVCSRRGGKTEGAVRRTALLITEKPGARVLYITLIRRNSRKLFFEPLRAYLQAKGVAFEPNETDLTLKLANGSYVECSSCSDLDDVDKHRGDKWDLVLIDEAQSFRDEVMRMLVDEALLPSLGDRRGSLDLLGTPPPSGPVGYLYEVFSSGRFGRFHWSLFDNPHFPQDEIKTLCEARGLTPEHPIYKREFLGEFVVDLESLVYEYLVGRNDMPVDGRPEPENDNWRFSIGLDLGFQDRDAIAVAGWRRDDPEHRLYEAWSWQKNHQDVDQLAAVFVEAYRKWRPQIIIGDTGGHGAVKVLKSLESRLGGVPIQSKPASLLDSIGLTNDDFRTGRILLDPHGPIAHDCKLVTWSPGKIRQEVSNAYHSDITEAWRYAVWGARHFKGKAAAPEPTRTELRAKRWAEKNRAMADPWNPRNFRRRAV
jgi:hypothetical protein